MRYLAIVQYDGTNFLGWQIQSKGRTVQEEIEKAISRILNTPTKIYGSGRTDAGVHALGQTFHFDAKEIDNLGKFKYSLNQVLPEDIHVLSVVDVEDDFNARISATSKTYLYVLNIGDYDVFNRDFACQYLRPLNVEAMIDAIEVFNGEHNFQNFTSKEEDEKGFVRTIYGSHIEVVNNQILFTFNGNGFMRYMVRMIVGSLIEVGLGKLSKDELSYYLNKKERNVVSYKAEAKGLFLVKVMY